MKFSKRNVPDAASRRFSLSLERLEARILLSGVTVDGGFSRFGPVPALDGFDAEPDGNGSYYKPGEILVKFDTATVASAESLLDGLEQASVLHAYRTVSGALVQLPDNMTVPEGLDYFAGLPGVEYAEPNYIVGLDQTFPDDPDFAQLWGLHNTGQSGGTADADIDAPEAWDLTTGSSTVIVGVIDTGVDYTHPDLAANMWQNPGEIPGNAVDDDGNGYIDDVFGWDFYNDTNDPMDLAGHGTHVSGTIGAVGNNSLGVVGVNWTVKIAALKFLGPSGGFTSDAVRAVDYATMMDFDLTSNSWGGGGFSQLLYDAIDAAGQQDHLFIAAAGNDSSDTDVLAHYPSSYDLPNVISVASTTDADQLSGFSNYGATSVDLAAPGSNIYSTMPGATYGSMSGTSMATPQVSGVAALAYAIQPDATYQEVRDAIFLGVDPIPALSGSMVTGGRLNAYNALQGLRMAVVSSDPADQQVVGVAPQDFVINFSGAYDPGTVDVTDLTVNGLNPAGFTLTDADTVTYQFSSSPAAAEGPQAMSMADGAVQRLSDSRDVTAWSATFYYDVDPLVVLATSPVDGAVGDITGSAVLLTVDFSDAIDPASVATDDLLPSQGVITTATVVDADTVEYTVGGLTSEGVVTYSFEQGGVFDLVGNPLLAYQGSFDADFDVADYPTPLVGLAPAGSLIYDPAVSGGLFDATDVDAFTIDLDAPDQTVGLSAVPGDPSLILTIDLYEPGNPSAIASGVASGPGAAVVMQTTAITDPGTYTVEVASVGGSGAYTLDLVLNAAIEEEELSAPAASNDSRASAQNISGSFIQLESLRRAAVTGRTNSSMSGVFALDDGGYIHAIDVATGQIARTLPNRVPESIFYLWAANLAFDGSDLWFNYSYVAAGEGSSRIYRLDADTGAVTWSFDSGVGNSAGLAYDNGNLYVEDFTAGTIRVFSTATGSQVGSLPGMPNGDPFVVGLAGDELWAVSQLSWMYELDPASGSVLNDGPTFSPDWEQGMASLGGRLFVSHANNQITVYDAATLGYVDTLDVPVPGGALLCGLGGDGVPQAVTDDPDWYAVDLSAGDTASFDLASTVDLDLRLYDGSGALVANGAVSGAGRSIDRFTVGAAATYYVEVSSPGGWPGDYGLVVTVDGIFDREPNDSVLTAQPADGVQGALGHAGGGDSDFFSLTVAAGDAIMLRTEVPAGGPGEFVNALDPYLTLYNAGGAIVATDDNSFDGLNARIVHIVPSGQGGVWTVEVGASSGSGEYLMLLTAAPSVPDLMAASDTGVDSTDNLTGLDNSGPGSRLDFEIRGTLAGSLVNLYADGVLIGSAVASGSSVVVTTDGVLDLTDGTHVMTARQVVAGLGESEDSRPLQVTVDTLAPGAPPAPDLQAAGDSGISSTDNVTNVTSPTFDVASTDAYFRFYRNGAQISGDYQSGTAYGTAGQVEGAWTYAYAAVDAAGNVSALSPGLGVTIDTTPDAGVPTIDLRAESDTDFPDDNVTRLNDLIFDVVSSSPYFRIYRDGVGASQPPVLGDDGQVYRPGGSEQILGQPDGAYSYSAVGVDVAGNVTQSSAPLRVLITPMELIASHAYADGVTVMVYDANFRNGVSTPVIAWNRDVYVRGVTDLLVDPGRTGDRVLSGITLEGDGTGTAELAIIVEGDAGINRVQDRRTGGEPLAAFASDGYIRSASFGFGLTGANLNGFVTDSGHSIPWDHDGDGSLNDFTGLHARNDVGNVTVGGDVDGDVVVVGDLASLQINGGDLDADVVLLGSELGRVDVRGHYDRGAAQWVGGSVSGTIRAPDGIRSVSARGGDFTGSVESAGPIGSVQVMMGRAGPAGTFGGSFSGLIDAGDGLRRVAVGRDLGGSLTVVGTLGRVSVGGDVSGADIDVDGTFLGLGGGGDFYNSTVAATRLGSVRVAGRITAAAPGLGRIWAEEGRFSLRSGTVAGWVDYTHSYSIRDVLVGVTGA